MIIQYEKLINQYKILQQFAFFVDTSIYKPTKKEKDKITLYSHDEFYSLDVSYSYDIDQCTVLTVI